MMQMISLYRCNSSAYSNDLHLCPIVPCSGTITVFDYAQSSSSATTKRLKRVPSKEMMITTDEETNIILLKQVLMDRKSTQDLVQDLIACNSDAAVKVRYCAAMEEFSKTKDAMERNAKGNKIVSMFLRNGSMFQCSGVPKQAQNQMVWKSFEILILLRNQFELELVQLFETQRALKRIVRGGGAL